jgi:hypothetical protein
MIIPAESVYAVFEAKQSINAEQVAYAKKKVESVRRLDRASLPIPYAGGVHPAKPPGHIMGCLLTFESDWSPALSEPLKGDLAGTDSAGRLDLGCVAAHGTLVAMRVSATRSFPKASQRLRFCSN